MRSFYHDIKRSRKTTKAGNFITELIVLATPIGQLFKKNVKTNKFPRERISQIRKFNDQKRN